MSEWMYILICLVLFFLVLRVIWRKPAKTKNEGKRISYDLFELERGIRDSLTQVVNQNLSRLNIRESEMEKLRKTRSVLRNALRTCGLGDSGAKDYVKDYMKELLQRKYLITPETIDEVIPFAEIEQLTIRDKFDILLFLYRRKFGYGRRALEQILTQYGLDDLKQDKTGKMRYEVTKEEIEEIYLDELCKLNFAAKLEIVTQRIFSMNKGNGVIDDLIYQKIDGVSGGVEGAPGDNYQSVYIMFRGKSIHLSFLSFETEKELRRICKNIYKFDAPGQMSQASGFIVNNLKSGARVSDMRPPFASAWTFWIRMFDSVERRRIEELFPQKGREKLKNLLSFLIKGEQTCVISGQQGSGKTTCLEALIDYINPVYNIRTIELTFELQLQKVYPNRNIAAMRETKNVSTEEAIEFVKKTDADVVIFGEIAKEIEGEKVIKLSQSGSKFSLSTHHGISTEAMMNWFRNALLHCSGFHNERVAQEQVAESIRFDIHLAKCPDGTRIVERITEIIKNSSDAKKAYQTQDIMCFEKGEYKILHSISEKTKEAIMRYLEQEEQAMFLQLMEEGR
ncbi:MAG: ATPase, T2SS/T4P/T4SS family [Velocimicrobium sp.]